MDVYIPIVYTDSLWPGIQLIVTNGLMLCDGCLYTYSIYGLVIIGIQLLLTNGQMLCDGCLYTYSIYGLVITWITVTFNEWAKVM